MKAENVSYWKNDFWRVDKMTSQTLEKSGGIYIKGYVFLSPTQDFVLWTKLQQV